MSKWVCSHCNAINASGAFKCHACPNSTGDEQVNLQWQRSQNYIDRTQGKYSNPETFESLKEELEKLTKAAEVMEKALEFYARGSFNFENNELIAKQALETFRKESGK